MPGFFRIFGATNFSRPQFHGESENRGLRCLRELIIPEHFILKSAVSQSISVKIIHAELVCQELTGKVPSKLIQHEKVPGKLIQHEIF